MPSQQSSHGQPAFASGEPLDFLKLLVHVLVSPFKSQARLEAEIVVLRQQLMVLRQRLPSKPKLTVADRLAFVWLYRLFPSVLNDRPAMASVGIVTSPGRLRPISWSGSQLDEEEQLQRLPLSARGLKQAGIVTLLNEERKKAASRKSSSDRRTPDVHRRSAEAAMRRR